jgi:type IV secretion system protein VirD4
MPSGGGEAHWDESAKAIIEGLLLHVATFPAYEGRRNLVTVRKLLMHEMNDSLRKEMDKNDAVDGIVQGAASDFFERAENERMGVLSTTRRHTKFLDYRAMQEALSDPEDSGKRFELTDLKTKPEGMTLYVGMPVGRIATSCNRMFRMIVGLTLEAMEREQRKDNETVVLLDEYANAVGPMRSVEVAAGLVAGMGCKLVFVLQGLSQIQNINKDWETLLSNSGLQIFYGNSDLTTTEYISKRCGQTTVMVESEGRGAITQRTDSGAGRSRSPQVTSLITADEAAKLFARDDPLTRMLVLWSGHDPIVLQRTKYYEYAPFSRLYSRW